MYTAHIICLLHHHHPSCFLYDLCQMPDIGCLLISTMWFASYWSLRHNFSICYLRQEVTSVVAALSWNRWSINVLNDKRERKRKQKRGGNGLLMGCCCVKKGAFPDLALDVTSLSTQGQDRMRTLIKLVSKIAYLSFTHTHTQTHCGQTMTLGLCSDT